MDRRRILLVVAAVVAAMGAALVFVYARSAENRAAEKYETVDTLVVTSQIDAGESANSAYENGKIVIEEVPRGERLEGATTDGETFSDQYALTTLYPGEQLIPEKFGGADEVQSETTLPIPEGMVAISVSLSDTARVGGFIKPGAQVGIFLSGVLPPQNVQSTKLLLRDVLVLATGSTTTLEAPPEGEDPANAEQLPNTLFTLAVTQRQAEQILLAQSQGELAFALVNRNSELKPGDGVSAGELFDE